MTEVFGPCGIGWKYEIVSQRTYDGPEGQVMAVVDVNLSILTKTPIGDGWSDPIPGTGGSMLVANERNGPHFNDEAFKMALTDALSVAMKALGVGSDIYMGAWTGTKYLTPAPEKTTAPAGNDTFTEEDNLKKPEEPKKPGRKPKRYEFTSPEVQDQYRAITGDNPTADEKALFKYICSQVGITTLAEGITTPQLKALKAGVGKELKDGFYSQALLKENSDA